MRSSFMHVCYLCSSSNTNLVGRNIDFDTNIYICTDCGLIQNDFVSSAYLDYYYHKKYREVRKEKITPVYLEFMSRRANSQKEFIKNSLPSNISFKNVIDIGAGAGKLIESFMPDSHLFAVESDSIMIEHMSKNRAITVINEPTLFEADNQSRFDLLTMSHVFEHINNPLEYLYQLHKVVSSDGYVFLEVPNEPINLVSHHIKQKKKGIGHLFDYTIATLNLMISKSKLFDVVALKTYSISVSEYIESGHLVNFDENKQGDGIYIRCLLQKRNSKYYEPEYHYVDSVLQSRYMYQYRLEEKLKKLTEELSAKNKQVKSAYAAIESLQDSFKKMKKLYLDLLT